MKRLRGKLTYSNVISTLCLFLLIGGGTAIAAGGLGKETVGSRQLKKEAVTPLKLSPASKATLVGPTGKAGPQGPQGPQGPRGATGLTNQKLIQATGTGSASAQCGPGETLTGGGGSAGGALKGSFPNAVNPGEPGRWTVQALNGAEGVEVRILCSSP